MITRFTLLLIVSGLLGTTVAAQKVSRAEINDIKYKYLGLCEFPHYTKKTSPIIETDADGKKFVVGEIEGSYDINKLCIIKAFTKTAKGKKVQEFYLYDGELIFVYELEESVELYTNEQGQAQKRKRTDFECSYYLKNGKLLERKVKKEKETPEELSTKQMEDQFAGLVALYTKQLKNTRDIPPKK